MADKVLKQEPQHKWLSLSFWFLQENLINSYLHVCALFLSASFSKIVTWCCPCTCGWCVILAGLHVHWWMMSNRLSFPHKAQVEVAIALKTKLKWTIPREFPDYQWLFQMQHFSHSGTKLAGEEKKKKKKKKKRNNSEFWLFQVGSTLLLLL